MLATKSSPQNFRLKMSTIYNNFHGSRIWVLSWTAWFWITYMIVIKVSIKGTDIWRSDCKQRITFQDGTLIAVNRRPQFFVGHSPLYLCRVLKMWQLASPEREDLKRLWEKPLTSMTWYLNSQTVELALFHLLESSHQVRPILKGSEISPHLLNGEIIGISYNHPSGHREVLICAKRKGRENAISSVCLGPSLSPWLTCLPSPRPIPVLFEHHS